MRSSLKRLLQIVIVTAAIAICADLLSSLAPRTPLPSTAAGWNLAAPQDCATPVPAGLRQWRGVARARSVCRGKYGGSPEMTLTLYDMPEWGASAFDAWQKWQTQPGKMAFYKGRYFGVVESPAADMNTLNRLALAVEATLPPGSEARR
jgi:hypothetical protein